MSLLMMSSSSSGTVGSTSRASRLRASRTAKMSSTSVAAAKGAASVSISYITVPSEKRSERWSSFLPIACSGDMYLTLPLMTPVLVCTRVVVALAMPKSHSLTSPRYDRSTLDGDTSR